MSTVQQYTRRHRARPRTTNRNDTTLYIVYWFKFEVFKVGVTDRADRLRKHASTGGKTLLTIPHTSTRQEHEAILHVGYAFDRAFLDYQSAEAVLGKNGRGYTECFKVPLRHLMGATELACLGVRRGADEKNPNDQA